ncbi:MAG: hypothetical protein HDR03_14470 [Lachnospiraceae bacterium]|nr:hypothetical protein [Lachnospiraceae bacterium]
MTILSTREWATVIWGFVLFLYAITRRQIREPFLEAVKIFFGRKLRILWGIISLYVLGITLIFYHLPFWDNIYIKDIIVWIVFSGLIYCMNAVSKEADEKYIGKVLKDNIKFTIILEFVMSIFTFNIWVELAIIPIITVIVFMNIFAKQKEEYKEVHKLLDTVLAITGFWVLYETIKIGIQEYKELNVLNIFISFMIPIAYLIMIIPLEYVLELYSKYELLFVRMSYKEGKDKKIQNRHHWLVIRTCKFSVRKVLIFQNKYWCKMYRSMPETDFERMIEQFRNECGER